MKKNIKTRGRVIRSLIGLTIIGLGVYSHSWWGLLGVFILFEAIMGWCLIHQMCGSSECGKDKLGK